MAKELDPNLVSQLRNKYLPSSLQLIDDRGGYGDVYVISRVSDGAKFALKVYSDPRDIRNHNEVVVLRALAELKNPYLLVLEEVFEVDVGSGGHCEKYPLGLVLELCRTSLRKELNRVGRLKPEAACKVVREIALGLQAMHEVGILHRDVKLENILLSSTGTAKLCDFGTARSWTTKPTVAGSTYPRTPGHSPPEANTNERPEMPYDVYTLGTVLFECLTGKNFKAQMEKARKSKEIVIRKELGEFPGLIDVIERCVQTSPKNRIGLQELADTLEPHCSSTPVPPAVPADVQGVGADDSTPVLALTAVPVDVAVPRPDTRSWGRWHVPVAAALVAILVLGSLAVGVELYNQQESRIAQQDTRHEAVVNDFRKLQEELDKRRQTEADHSTARNIQEGRINAIRKEFEEFKNQRAADQVALTSYQTTAKQANEEIQRLLGILDVQVKVNGEWLYGLDAAVDRLRFDQGQTADAVRSVQEEYKAADKVMKNLQVELSQLGNTLTSRLDGSEAGVCGLQDDLSRIAATVKSVQEKFEAADSGMKELRAQLERTKNNRRVVPCEFGKRVMIASIHGSDPALLQVSYFNPPTGETPDKAGETPDTTAAITAVAALLSLTSSHVTFSKPFLVDPNRGNGSCETSLYACPTLRGGEDPPTDYEQFCTLWVARFEWRSEKNDSGETVLNVYVTVDPEKKSEDGTGKDVRGTMYVSVIPFARSKPDGGKKE